MRGAILLLPHTSSSYGVYLSTRATFLTSIRGFAEAGKSSSLLTTYLSQIRINILLPSKSTSSGLTLLKLSGYNFEFLLT
jgi:hypothetical protein